MCAMHCHFFSYNTMGRLKSTSAMIARLWATRILVRHYEHIICMWCTPFALNGNLQVDKLGHRDFQVKFNLQDFAIVIVIFIA